jgi:hypothetical protein
MLAAVVALINKVGLTSLAIPYGRSSAVLLRRKLTVLLSALVMMVVLVVLAVPALAVPPQQNEHNCYGYGSSRAAQDQPSPTPTPVSGHPGNEVAEFQQGARDELANCGANEGVVPTTAE